MRPAVATLAILAAGALSPAFADPPANPVEDSTSQSSAVHAVPATPAVTAAKTPAVAPATPSTSAEQVQEQERLLRNQGYKLRMLQGQEKYCRREIPLGSHLATVMHCVTVAGAEAMAREGRETAERIQRNSVGCLNKALGGCGN
jgi:hypothetical protein